MFWQHIHLRYHNLRSSDWDGSSADAWTAVSAILVSWLSAAQDNEFGGQLDQRTSELFYGRLALLLSMAVDLTRTGEAVVSAKVRPSDPRPWLGSSPPDCWNSPFFEVIPRFTSKLGGWYGTVVGKGGWGFVYILPGNPRVNFSNNLATYAILPAFSTQMTITIIIIY